MADSTQTSQMYLERVDDKIPHDFVVPIKQIHSGEDVSTFLMSKAYRDITRFVLQLNRAVFPRKTDATGAELRFQKFEVGSSSIQFSETVLQLRRLLAALGDIITEVPLDTGPRRFGNLSFRKWYELVEARTKGLLEQYLPSHVLSFSHNSEISALDELQNYLLGSFGSAQRLDYGTGHELSFVAFLGCIWKLGGFTPSDPGQEERGIVFGVIEPYFGLIRRLITIYTLEPAGSHGVWGLDDHSFLPYIFGSAQYSPPIADADPVPTEGSLTGAPDPGGVTKLALVEKQRKINMYFGAIGFIYDVKKGPFWEHSPTLYDISGVRAGWAKINKGMLKMYNAEVLAKFPVVQHFPFGSLFIWERDPYAIEPPASVHASNQPKRNDAGSVSINSASQRYPTQEVTKLPWGATNQNQPEALSRTPVPWASQPASAVRANITAMGSNSASSQFTVPVPHRQFEPISVGSSPRTYDQVQTNTGNHEIGANAMPPPTKAPWAK